MEGRFLSRKEQGFVSPLHTPRVGQQGPVSERLYCFFLSLSNSLSLLSLRERIVDAVEHREDAQRVRERVVKVQQRAHQNALGEVAAQDLEDHPDDVEHRGLHRVEAHKVVELFVADDAEVDKEEDNERRELGGVVVGGEGAWWLVVVFERVFFV